MHQLTVNQGTHGTKILFLISGESSGSGAMGSGCEPHAAVGVRLLWPGVHQPKWWWGQSTPFELAVLVNHNLVLIIKSIQAGSLVCWQQGHGCGCVGFWSFRDDFLHQTSFELLSCFWPDLVYCLLLVCLWPNLVCCRLLVLLWPDLVCCLLLVFLWPDLVCCVLLVSLWLNLVCCVLLTSLFVTRFGRLVVRVKSAVQKSELLDSRSRARLQISHT